MRIYVASSWRNEAKQQEVVRELKTFQPGWQPSQPDMLADDWQIVES